MSQSEAAASQFRRRRQPWESWDVRWHSTFIDVSVAAPRSDGDSSPAASPRAHSDPGSVAASHASHDFFRHEREYVSNLSGWWSRHGGRSFASGDIDDVEARLEEVQLDTADVDVESLTVTAGDPGSGSLSKEELLDISRRADEKKPNVTRTELATHICKATHAMQQKLSHRRYSAMLSAIQEIPEQVGDALQRSADSLLGEVMDGVAHVTDLVCGHSPSHVHTQEEIAAVATLTTIPELVQERQHEGIVAAQQHLQQHVDGLMSVLDQKARSEVVEDIRAMPSEVEEITRQALAASAKACRLEVQEQLNTALQLLNQPLPPQRLNPELFHQKRQLIAELSPLAAPALEASAQAAHDVVADAVGTALAVATEKAHETQTLANQVVADALLRAKVGRPLEDLAANLAVEAAIASDSGAASDAGLQAAPQAASASSAAPPRRDGARRRGDGSGAGLLLKSIRLPPEEGGGGSYYGSSEGSVGHPELCSRPCIYVAEGRCANGSECNYCHLPHLKRPIHLDKQHRELMRGLGFPEMLGLILPILQSKLEHISLSPESLEHLDALKKCPQGRPLAGWRQQKVSGPLRSMSMRSLLSLLLKSGPTEIDKCHIERLTHLLRHDVAQRVPPDPSSLPSPGIASLQIL